jgi:hypothetical protein
MNSDTDNVSAALQIWQLPQLTLMHARQTGVLTCVTATNAAQALT